MARCCSCYRPVTGTPGPARPTTGPQRTASSLTHAEWHGQLRQAGFTRIATVPDEERDPAAVLEQHLYVATPSGLR
jgi:hypothetical protein